VSWPIRLAQSGDRPQLMALWAQAFGDSPGVIQDYFANRHADENMLVYVEEKTLCGMLSMLPLTLTAGGAAYPARYVYAVATAPAFRGRGIATELLNRAHGEMARKGDQASVLVPASASLFDYYAKRGYRTAFFLDIRKFDPPPFPAGGHFEDCAPAEYARLRDAAFLGEPLYARWAEDAVAFAARGMGLTKLKLGAEIGCALWERREDGGVLVRELAAPGMNVQDAMGILHAAAGATAYQVRLPGRETPFGMIRWLIPEPPGMGAPGYLSLALD
jgi:predicted N-acetyltransferase YhbS